jgi:hypothetical protein
MCEVSSRQHSAYLTDIRRNASAGFSLRVERVPVAYHRKLIGRLQGRPRLLGFKAHVGVSSSVDHEGGLLSRRVYRCSERCPSAFNRFELPSWMLYQDVQLLWDSGLGRGESGYSL